MSKNTFDDEFSFSAEKVYVHHWPPETPKWTNSREEKVSQDINQNRNKKQIIISGKIVKIDNYEFRSIKKVGLTIPQFKRQTTMIFEGHCDEFDAHVHITTKSDNFLEIFNKLMIWRDIFFPDTPYLDSKN